jgi:hypothetical protein
MAMRLLGNAFPAFHRDRFGLVKKPAEAVKGVVCPAIGDGGKMIFRQFNFRGISGLR